MNSQEHLVLENLLNQLVAARVEQRDPDAEALIRSACQRQPDAAYLLTLRTLLQGQALDQAQQRITQLETELASLRAQSAQGNRAPASGGFLDVQSWGRQPSPPPAPAPQAAPAQFNPAPQPTARSGGFLGGAGGSFLGNVATTAAGVVAGGLLFQGISNMMGNHGSSGHGLFGDNSSPERTTENVVVNNFYDDTGNTPDAQRNDFSALDFDADTPPDDGSWT
jgi:hypothetical protein